VKKHFVLIAAPLFLLLAFYCLNHGNYFVNRAIAWEPGDGNFINSTNANATNANATNANATNANATNANATNANSTNANATNANATNANATNANPTNSVNTTSSIPITSATAKGPTDGRSLGVMVQVSPFPLKTGDAKFKISFLQPSSEAIQVHIDYDVVITKANTELFRASASTGQPLLHTAEGIVNIPYKFNSPGDYTLEVSVMGINFIPIRTENIKFDFEVS
jgi:hypothetical protein